jgi:hypothetical protein
MSDNAWDELLPEYRSGNLGWSTAGDFYCPLCHTIIGKNLKGELPFYWVSVHLKTHGGR